MVTLQQTISPLDEMREVGMNEHTTGRNGVIEAMPQLPHDHRPSVHPARPTSTTGPRAISPSPGQKTHSMRNDQMVYECSDQECGLPCVPPPKRTVRENSTRTYLADASLQEGASEAEAIEAQANAMAEERNRVLSTTHFVHVGWDRSIFF